MALVFYAMSGSPYAWRVWLALEHKGLPYELKMLSYDAGDLNRPEFAALNPYRKVPVIVDADFVLHESAAILEYLEDKAPHAPRLFAADPRWRAVQRRMVREADGYVAAALDRLVRAVLFTPQASWSQEKIDAASAGIKKELAAWDAAPAGDYLAGELSAVDFTLFPLLALVRRMQRRNPGVLSPGVIRPDLDAWMDRMESLPVTQKTWPPHWKT